VNLLSLESSLEDIISKDRENRSKRMEISVRPKGKEIKQEVERFKAVMQHPQFKTNPLKTIRQHFQNTWETKEGMKL
jgi:ABC-type glutathione transport system ATPase component